jgi:hypothetical protein
MSGRIVFPIKNPKGQLVAYAGRSIDGTEPEYKFPAGFRKRLELWNLSEVTAHERGACRGLLREPKKPRPKSYRDSQTKRERRVRPPAAA